MTDELLSEQARYYAARAGEYDDWWFRRGRYDRGPIATARWFAEIAEVERAVDRFVPPGHVLELACGTGLWTGRLARRARRVTALDRSPEVLALAGARLADAGDARRVELREADLFDWRPEPIHDAVFFAFWLSHVPEERFEAFWAGVRAALRPGGRVFLVDSRRADASTATDHVLPEVGEETMLRRLDDGQEFRVVKRFHDPEALTERLAALGWRAELRTTDEFFVFGTVEAADAGRGP